MKFGKVWAFSALALAAKNNVLAILRSKSATHVCRTLNAPINARSLSKLALHWSPVAMPMGQTAFIAALVLGAILMFWPGL